MNPSFARVKQNEGMLALLYGTPNVDFQARV